MSQNSPATASTQLSQLLDDFWEWQMRYYPTWATYMGDKRYDSLLTDISPQARSAAEVTTREYLAKANQIDRSVLTSEEQVSLDMFRGRLQESIDNEPFKDYTMPVSQQDGPHHMLPQLVGTMDFSTAQDYDNFEKRLRAFPKYVNYTVEDMREGIGLGIMAARVNIEPVSTQIAALIEQDYKKSIFYTPLRENKAGSPAAELKKFDKRYEDAIINQVNSALRFLDNFIKIEYLPRCRQQIGVVALPDGKARYLALIKQHTTLPLSPEEITEMGYADLEWIHAAMDSVMKSIGWTGTRQQFFDHLHTNPEFYYADADSLVSRYESILRGMEARLPELFGRLPKAPCEIKVIEPFRSADATTAFYSGPAEDGSRPGQYYVNTYALDQRPKYEMEALSYHESVPGHHLQIAIAQELEGLPKFRKNTWVTAFGEGWALYSERLPKEVGFYKDPYSEFGRLIYEAWRACRLVVDVGIHYFGWDRETAITFMKVNYGGTDHNIAKEVDRYIASPGQALGYKIGQLKILELRKRAEKAMGTSFDIRAFHDRVLESGCIPLNVLEAKIDAWIASQE
ncbi:MAG: DUF885 domain-containing protein [Candidatus Zixiibacteriota bacterium]